MIMEESKKSKKSKKKKNRPASNTPADPPSHHASTPHLPHSTSNGGSNLNHNNNNNNGSAQTSSLHSHPPPPPPSSSSSSPSPPSHDVSPPDPPALPFNGDIPVENRSKDNEEDEAEEQAEDKRSPSQVPLPNLDFEKEMLSYQQVIRELKMALASETDSKHALQILIEDLRSSHEATKLDAIRELCHSLASFHHEQSEDLELRVKQLMDELIQLRESGRHEKVAEIGEIQHLQEENMRLKATCKLQGQIEAAKHTEVEQLKEDNSQLREDNIRLVRKVEEMKNTVERFQQEHRQLTTKVSAMQMGINQFEREAAIRSHVERELSLEKSKGWFGWGSRKTSAVEAAALAEDSRMQMVAAAGMVEKLVSENSALVEKVNEQTALIDRITRKYSYLMEMQRNDHMESIEAEKYIPVLDRDVQMNEVLPVIKDKSLTDEEVLPTIEDKRQLLEEEVMPTITSEKSELVEIMPLIGDRSQSEETRLRFVEEDLHTIVPEMINLDFQHIPPQTSKSETPQHAIVLDNDIKPFSDAPIMGAPIRFFSFIAKYVSGADLVNT